MFICLCVLGSVGLVLCGFAHACVWGPLYFFSRARVCVERENEQGVPSVESWVSQQRRLAVLTQVCDPFFPPNPPKEGRREEAAGRGSEGKGSVEFLIKTETTGPRSQNTRAIGERKFTALGS